MFTLLEKEMLQSWDLQVTKKQILWKKKKANFAVDAKNPTVFEVDSPCILVLAPKHFPNRFFLFGAIMFR
jgi:hypothetical protein